MAVGELTPLQVQQRENMSVLFGDGNPAKKTSKDPGERHTDAMRRTLEKQIKSTGSDRPVTLLNLNPTSLKINGGMFFPEEIPACPVNQPYVIHVFRETRWGHKDNGVDLSNVHRIDPFPAIPKTIAAEYMRQYQQEGDGFGGVICYVGDHHPSTIKKGAMVTVPVVTMVDGELVVDEEERDFHALLDIVRAKRNQSIMRRLQEANGWYENDEQRKNVNDLHRDMARMAKREGLIESLPRWVLIEDGTMEKTAEPCPSCMVTPKAGAIMCTNCSHVFNVIEAYKLARIAYGAVAMDRLTAEEWAIVNRIKAERDKARGIKKDVQ